MHHRMVIHCILSSFNIMSKPIEELLMFLAWMVEVREEAVAFIQLLLRFSVAQVRMVTCETRCSQRWLPKKILLTFQTSTSIMLIIEMDFIEVNYNLLDNWIVLLAAVSVDFLLFV